jgi:hypothetical protein
MLEHDPEKLQTFRTRSCDRTTAGSEITNQSEAISLERLLFSANVKPLQRLAGASQHQQHASDPACNMYFHAP